MNRPITAVIIGNEILAGRRRDAHLTNTVNACNARGLRLNGAVFLSDNTDDLIRTYQRLKTENHIILSFGGIGATPDDRTRQAVAKAYGVDLSFHPEGLAILEGKFSATQMNDGRKNLIAFPAGSSLIPNPINQIPGFSIEHTHCVPGFPQMAEPMIAWVLDTYYREMAQERAYIAINVFAPESAISPLMAAIERQFPNISVSSLPQIGHQTELGFEGRQQDITAALSQAKSWLDKQQYRYQ